ncbi:substrate-binding domain-containing protein [Acetivibrio saccincola]|uniref:HTH-type transcriptional regulator AscG n=1 Tax=Acetivibrio saccincola TaxID=1677857 RepID=A0A2K9EK34_9FIRM|nr:substrate-binding domain-containing protein [Acetivibrio saccincola]AUG56911.1 HTH-type transcriptional regulator AscG [Acetivibrio saccincola]
MTDNKAGMKSLVKHLVEDHNYKRIMFVTGPENNCEAMERYEGYLEVLKENNIPVDENIIFNGNFNSHTGYRIMKEVILNDIRYDAAVFLNDDMALGALKAIDDLSQKHEIDTFLFKETFEVPKKSILLYAFKDGERVEIKEDEKVFDTKRLVPESFIPKDRRFYYLINPLYFEEDNFGFLCFELVNDDIIHFESLWAQISNILNGALILMEKDKIKK